MKPERHSSGRELTHALTLSAHCQWTCQENVISQNLRSPVTCPIPPQNRRPLSLTDPHKRFSEPTSRAQPPSRIGGRLTTSANSIRRWFPSSFLPCGVEPDLRIRSWESFPSRNGGC